jgi:tetratricopeptide (TPR) repeat protein
LQDPVNLKALEHAAEMNATIGSIQKDAKTQQLYYESALAFAQRAYNADSSQADAAYVMAMAFGKMTDVESDKKKLVDDVRQVRLYADKALTINPDHGRANYAMGKWEYQVATLAGWKKTAVKLLYGGLPDASLEKAISYMEKCRHLEPYFVRNYLDLAKAYRDNHQPAQAIEVLTRLVKLPTRSSPDPALKAEGATLLEQMQ